MEEIALWLRFLLSRGSLMVLALVYLAFFIAIHSNPFFYIDLNRILPLPYSLAEMGYLIKVVVYLIVVFTILLPCSSCS